MNLQILNRSNLKKLLGHVDKVLEKHGYEGYGTPQKIKVDASLSAIKKLNRQRFFSVCAVESLYELYNLHIPTENKKLFQTLHCVDWADMTKDTIEYVNAIILKDLSKSLIYEPGTAVAIR